MKRSIWSAKLKEWSKNVKCYFKTQVRVRLCSGKTSCDHGPFDCKTKLKTKKKKEVKNTDFMCRHASVFPDWSGIRINRSETVLITSADLYWNHRQHIKQHVCHVTIKPKVCWCHGFIPPIQNKNTFIFPRVPSTLMVPQDTVSRSRSLSWVHVEYLT